MAQGDFRVCPACGARNKAKWEFCARCGEALQDVTMVSSSGVAETPVDDAEIPVEEWAPPWTAGVMGVLLLAAVVGSAIWVGRSSAPAQPSAAAFGGWSTDAGPPPSKPVLSSVSEEQKEAASDWREGSTLLNKGDFRAAIKAFREAVASDPRCLSCRLGLAAALSRSGDTEGAIVEYRRVLSQSPEEAAALRDLGSLLLRNGDYSEAARDLGRAAKYNADDLALQQDLGYAFEKSGDLQRALDTYQAVVDRFPEANVTRTRLAEVLNEQGHPERAIALLRGSVEKDPEAPILRRQLGSLLERSGNGPEAAREYREYARLAPNATDAGALVERAKSLEEAPGPS